MIILATALVAITGTPRIAVSETFTVIPNQVNTMQVCQELAADYIQKTNQELTRIGFQAGQNPSVRPIARCIGS